MIGSFNKVPAGITRSRLLREDEVIAVRAGHPLTRGRVSRERLVEFPHIVVDPGGTEEKETDGFIDGDGAGHRVWNERGLQGLQTGTIDLVGRMTVCVPNFAAVAPFLQLSDMVATLPRRLALRTAVHAPLSLLETPHPPVAIDIEMLWDQSTDAELLRAAAFFLILFLHQTCRWLRVKRQSLGGLVYFSSWKSAALYGTLSDSG